MLFVFLISQWVLTPIWTGGFSVGIALGEGKSDDTIRAYCVHISSNTIKEFTYSNAWINTGNINLPFYCEKSVIVADGRNDGINRIYAGEFFGSGNTAEYTWTGSSWSYLNMGAAGQQLINLVYGDARNDGIKRLYFSTGSAPPYNSCWEYSYTGNWTYSPISSPSGYYMGNFGIAIGDGRNDGTKRLYIGIYPGYVLCEYTYSGNWSYNIIATGLSQVMGLAIGDGRNDGINRLYVACRYEGIREYTYSGGTWNLTATIPVSGEIFDIDIAKARNDNLNRLYCVTYTGSLYEATYTGSWTINQIGSPGGSLFKVKCGYGRNDNKLRVYVAGSGGFFEYEYLAGICENYKPGIYYPFFKNGKIEFISENSSFSEISIFDISGREIFKNNFKIKKGKNIISLPFKNLKSGSYFIKIKIDEKEFSTKIMFL